MISQISDSEWIKRFNEFSKVEFIRRYQEYFQTNESPESRPIFTVETKWFTEEGKKELKSKSLQEQYDVVLKAVKDNMFDNAKKIFHIDDNMVKGFSVWRQMKIEKSKTEDNVMHFILILEDSGPNYSQDKKWIESEYLKFYDKILRKSMSLAAGDYFGIYYDNKTEKIGFTKHFTTKNRTGKRLKNELEKKMEEFIEQLEREDKTIFYIMKSPSIDLFVKSSIKQEFKEKVQQAFYNYVDIKDKKYSDMDSRNEFF